LLPHGTLADNGKRHFKMEEMARNPERMSRVQWFYRLIEEHALLGISCHIRPSDVARAKARIWVPDLNIDWGYIDNPYWLSFRVLLDMFHWNKEQIDQFLPGVVRSISSLMTVARRRRSSPRGTNTST
jgi:hypothetical protein